MHLKHRHSCSHDHQPCVIISPEIGPPLITDTSYFLSFLLSLTLKVGYVKVHIYVYNTSICDGINLKSLAQMQKHLKAITTVKAIQKRT